MQWKKRTQGVQARDSAIEFPIPEHWAHHNRQSHSLFGHLARTAPNSVQTMWVLPTSALKPAGTCLVERPSGVEGTHPEPQLAFKSGTAATLSITARGYVACQPYRRRTKCSDLLQVELYGRTEGRNEVRQAHLLQRLHKIQA